MTNRPVTDNQWGLSLPWLTAAVLVLVASGLVAMWLNSTAMTADRDTLNRGADAVQSAIEEQVKVLKLAGTGTASMVGTPMTEFDLESVVRQMDVTLLRSMLAGIIYPVGPDRVGEGAFVAPGLIQVPNLEVPPIDASREAIESIAASGGIYLSPPLHATDPERVDYVLALPEGSGQDLRLIAILFRPDRMLGGAVDAGDQYAVNLVDARHDDRVIVSLGEPSAGLVARRQPDGLEGALQIDVHPGERFPFASSPWVTATAIVIGAVIASLLVWMGRMARARARDFAERLRLAQELSESKDRFLATVSHELRTPLTVVLGVAAEVGPNWDALGASDRNELLAMLTEQAGEAANIVEDLLVAARSDPSQLRLAMEDTDLLPHLDYAIGSLAESARSRVVNGVANRQVHVDSSRLRQILRNLLENAVRYGGEEVTVECRQHADRLVLSVSDNGGNLDPGDVERIFEPYEQSRSAGTEAPHGVGIGLYVSRLLARLMNGDLDCVCTDGYTRFRLTLQLSATETAAQSEPILTR